MRKRNLRKPRRPCILLDARTAVEGMDEQAHGRENAMVNHERFADDYAGGARRPSKGGWTRGKRPNV